MKRYVLGSACLAISLIVGVTFIAKETSWYQGLQAFAENTAASCPVPMPGWQKAPIPQANAMASSSLAPKPAFLMQATKTIVSTQNTVSTKTAASPPSTRYPLRFVGAAAPVEASTQSSAQPTPQATPGAPQGDDIQVQVSAPGVKQGQVVRVTVKTGPEIPLEPQWVQLSGDKKIPLFKDAEGVYFAVLPIEVSEPTGDRTLAILDGKLGTLTQQTLTVLPGQYSKQNIGVSKSMGSLEPTAEELAAIDGLKKAVSPVRYWKNNATFIKPVPDCLVSYFGNLRYHNGKFSGNYHKGVDQRSPSGRPIQAIADGKIMVAKQYRLHGGTVGIDHGQGLTSIYIHQSKIAVKVGDIVKQGDVVGYVGATGFATGPHIHWGMYVHNVPVNPLQWVKIPHC